MKMKDLDTDDRILIRDIVDMVVSDNVNVNTNARVILRDPNLVIVFPFMEEIIGIADKDDMLQALEDKAKSIKNTSLRAIVTMRIISGKIRKNRDARSD